MDQCHLKALIHQFPEIICMRNISSGNVSCQGKGRPDASPGSFFFSRSLAPKDVEQGQRRIGVREHVSKREKKSQKGNYNWLLRRCIYFAFCFAELLAGYFRESCLSLQISQKQFLGWKKKEDKSCFVYFSHLYMGFVSLIKWFYLIMKSPPRKEEKKNWRDWFHFILWSENKVLVHL